MNKVALITGAGRGMGRAISIELASLGYDLYLVSRTEKELLETLTYLDYADKVDIIPADLSKESEVLRVFNRIDKLDVLINNAGQFLIAPITEFTSSDYHRIMNINVKAVFECCREALKLMIPQRSGYIINISSVSGFKGYANHGIYAASKHAVLGISRVLADECKEHNIKVTAICPGATDTGMIKGLDKNILLRPADIAKTVSYLLSLSPQAVVNDIYVRRMV
jgi:3-oxoacyl-[acyl-carrier protein] reductase